MNAGRSEFTGQSWMQSLPWAFSLKSCVKKRDGDHAACRPCALHGQVKPFLRSWEKQVTAVQSVNH